MLGMAVSGFSADLGRRTARTPYDPYFGPVFSVMGGTDSTHPSLDYMREKLKEARRMPHRYDPDRPYVPQSPNVTERVRGGDCKAKALWLARELNDSNARFVVGKYRGSPARSHAWLLWSDGQKWWVLDPTFYDRPIPSGSGAWEPHYSYGKGGRYVHEGAR